ncbi:MAG: hypothetical protein COA58_05360 [Bacteroidetes bacterium]|nr:MAG: hypothetical protein COA58_05360 [Bacteroidota bacterium]
MKKTITTLTILFTLLVVEAQASQLFLRTNSFRAKATISGLIYHSQNGEFQVSQIRPGKHFITVTEKRNRSYTDNRRGYRQQGQNHHYGSNVLFQGKIFIPQGSNVFARITPRGHLIIDDVVPTRRGNQPHHRQDCRQPRQGGGSDYGNRGGGRSGNRNVRQPAHRPVQSNFNLALNTVRSASFESDRKTIAKQFLKNNDVTSQEVLLLIREFNFESSKLDIAKFAYASTVDPQNYFVVNQGFDFRSSIDALNRFIG